MIEICPTVTEEDADSFSSYITELAQFASRVHLDFADGVLAPRRLVEPSAVKLPGNVKYDVHLMYQNPSAVMEAVLSMKPHTVIIHIEADGDVVSMLNKIKNANVRAGLALLPESQPENFATAIQAADYVLIFGGSLGYQGGEADTSQLDKLPAIKAINSNAEIAWDGGVNQDNLKKFIESGVDVVNVGGFIKNSSDPKSAYAILQQIT